jgi:2-(1,2-epoxy-1,2-dihydrophenyl)acetyl-CoA isomerase
MSEAYENLLFTQDRGVATITLNRPSALNALNMALKADLANIIRIVKDDTNVRCVILTGSGKSFSAGGDIVEMDLNVNPVRSRNRLQILLRDIFIPLAELEKPTIAAVNGHAFGAGLSLALACDLILASDQANFSCAFTKLGLLPDCGALYFLPRRVPMTLAKDLIFTGRRFSAEEALAMNLINQVVSDDKLTETVNDMALELAAGPTVAFGISKRLLDRSLESSLHQMATLEEFGQAVLLSTDDNRNARDAFAKKTSPEYKGS